MELLTIGTILTVGSLVGIISLGAPLLPTIAIVLGIEFGYAAAVHSDKVEPYDFEQVEQMDTEITPDE